MFYSPRFCVYLCVLVLFSVVHANARVVYTSVVTWLNNFPEDSKVLH